MEPNTTAASSASGEIAKQWVQEQEALRKRVQTTDAIDFVCDPQTNTISGLRLVCGVDISYPRTDPDHAAAALVILTYPALEVVYELYETVQIKSPYIAGFLAFRESPAYLRLFERLKQSRPDLWPQVVLVDGNGLLHPRQFGSACHLGLSLDIPTIGVAKNLFHFDGMPLDARSIKDRFRGENGSDRPTEIVLSSDTGDGAVVYGAAVAPPANGDGSAVNPIFVSVGHRVTLASAIAIVRACSHFRIPEPIRVADIRSRMIARGIESRAKE